MSIKKYSFYFELDLSLGENIGSVARAIKNFSISQT